MRILTRRSGYLFSVRVTLMRALTATLRIVLYFQVWPFSYQLVYFFHLNFSGIAHVTTPISDVTLRAARRDLHGRDAAQRIRSLKRILCTYIYINVNIQLIVALTYPSCIYTRSLHFYSLFFPLNPGQHLWSQANPTVIHTS